MPAGGRAVDLRVRGEDLRLLVLAEADTGVGDLEPEEDARSFCLEAQHAHHHLTRVGELHRVADEVQQDLPQTSGVADHLRRNVALDIEDELDTLVGRRLAKQLDSLFGHVLRAEVD